MAHGFSAEKEMYLDKFADAFAKAGFASVVYDNRNFGASDGQPRQEIDPWLQVRDAITSKSDHEIWYSPVTKRSAGDGQ